MALGSIVFKDYSPQIQAKLQHAAEQWLEEASGEVESQAVRNTRVKTTKTKISWHHAVDKGNLEATVGSDYENAIWEEFGTGAYAEKGGRSGYWVFVEGGGSSGHGGKSYTLDEAKRIMAIMRKKGLNAYYTNGKRGTRAFRKAYTSTKPKLQKRAQQIFKDAIN